MNWLGSYWAWVGGNIGAIPLEAAITAAAGLLFRKPLQRAMAWLRREELEEARAARRIAADLYEHHTGHAHQLAPPHESEAK